MSRSALVALALVVATGCEDAQQPAASDSPDLSADAPATLVSGTITSADAAAELTAAGACVVDEICTSATSMAPLQAPGADAAFVYQLSIPAGVTPMVQLSAPGHMPALVAVGRAGSTAELGETQLITPAQLRAMGASREAGAGHLLVRASNAQGWPVADFQVHVSSQGAWKGAFGAAMVPDLAAGDYAVEISADGRTCAPDTDAAWAYGEGRYWMPVEPATVSMLNVVCD